jgi:threonyl-tRNA synthetase
LKYAENAEKQLQEKEIRTELDKRNETIGAKIRDAEEQKIPYMLVVGEREAAAGNVNVRRRGQKKLGEMTLNQFSQLIKEDIAKKRQV